MDIRLMSNLKGTLSTTSHCLKFKKSISFRRAVNGSPVNMNLSKGAMDATSCCRHAAEK